MVNPTELPPKNPAERRAWVLYRLRVCGSSLSRIAAAEGVSPQAVSNALDAPSSHLEEVIADTIGLTVKVLFADRFDSRGRRRSPTRERNRTSTVTGRNVEKQGFA
jgi:lambda repressor-like predicted transcriptional regulator